MNYIWHWHNYYCSSAYNTNILYSSYYFCISLRNYKLCIIIGHSIGRKQNKITIMIWQCTRFYRYSLIYSIKQHHKIVELCCLGLSRGSLSISKPTFPETEEAASCSAACAIFSSFKVLFAYTVKTTMVTTAIMNEIILYTISTVVIRCFPYCASAKVLISRPLLKIWQM